MQKYLEIFKFAVKEKMEYKAAFIFGGTFMLFNNSSFLFIFWLLTDYLQTTELQFLDFIFIHGITAFYYGFSHGVFANIGNLNSIIESGKIDYYLSFPIHPLKFLTFKNFDIMDFGDILFGIFALFFYILFSGGDFILFLKILFCLIFGLIFIFGLYVFIGSISFFLDKGSSIGNFFNSFFLTVGSYPPQIFKGKILIFSLTLIFGIYSSVFLPYKIINGGGVFEYFLMIFSSFFMIILGVWFFKKGLKNYSSGNLVNQM